MKLSITKERIGDFYHRMVSDGFITLDIKTEHENMPYPVTCRYELSSDDEAYIGVQLVIDTWEGRPAVLLWSFLNGMYVEDFIANYVEFNRWMIDLLSEEAVKRAHSVLETIIVGGKEVLETRVDTEGVEDIHSIVLTENYIKETMKLPHSCVMSFYGEVFDGVKEIEEHCKTQKDTSSPFVLKRVFDAIKHDDETYENEIVRCVNYFICKDAKTAESWLKRFVSMRQFSIFSNSIPDLWHRPPIICYAEGERYMLLDCKEGCLI